MRRSQLMKAGDPFHAFRQPATGQPPALLILETDIVVSLGPVHTGKDQPGLLPPQRYLDILSTRTPAAR